MRRRTVLAALAGAGGLRVGQRVGRGGGRSGRRSRSAGDSASIGGRGGEDDESALATQSAFGPAGRLAVPGVREAVTDADGTTAYLAVGDGIAVVDVTDPAAPSLLAEVRGLLADRDDGPMVQVADVAVSGDRLLAAGPRGRPDAVVPRGVAVFDVSDPASPERVGFHARDGPTHNVALDGRTAYVAGNPVAGGPLTVAELAGGDLTPVAEWSPTAVDARWSRVEGGLYGCHDVTVRDGVAYAAFWDAGAWLLDVGDPTSPEPVARLGGSDPGALARVPDRAAFTGVLELPGNAHHVRTNAAGDVVAVGREAFDLTETERPGGPGGITLWDVGDRAAPEPLSTLAPPAPERPERFGTLTAHNFGWRGDRLYTAWYGGGVRVYDLADPAAPRLLASWRDPADTFWTAVPAAEGFVAASTAVFADTAESGGALVAFPEPSGDGAPAPTRTPFPTPTPVGTPVEPTPTASPTPSSSPLPSATPTATGTTSRTSDGGEDDGSGIPGFGALAAAAGVGVAARLLGGRGDGSSGEE